MNHSIIVTIVLAAAMPSGAQTSVVSRLTEQLAQQLGKRSQMEALRMSCDHPTQQPPDSHELAVWLDGPVQIVSETDTENGQVTQKEYFLHESKVYAMRASHREPWNDGKMARVTESEFLFDGGTPIRRTIRIARVPAADRAPKLEKIAAKELPLPQDLARWGDKLTARAFDIARSFRAGVGRHAFGDWDQWLLKDAPPAGSGTTPPREAGWLPPPSTLVLPIPHTESPDGLYAIGWGYEKGPVDWAVLSDSNPNADFGAVNFGTKLATIELKPPLTDDANFLLSAPTGKPLGNIGSYHPGERKRFNHDELVVTWSPSAACFIVRETGKWADEAAGIGWIKEGHCQGTSDILKPLRQAANAALLKTKGPVAKRLRATPKDEEDSYSFSILGLQLEDDGHVDAAVMGQIPKSDEPDGMYEVEIEGVLSSGADDGPAVLKTTKVRVVSK